MDVSANNPLIVFVKQRELINNAKPLDEVAIIELALDKTEAEYGPYKIQVIPPMSRARSLSALSSNAFPNLVMQLSYDDDLLLKNPYSYINFPTDYGTNSYRICFARPDLLTKLQHTKTIHDLHQYTFGTGIGWLDTKILRANGLKVIEQTSAVNIFRMTKAGRIDLFCRGLIEFASETKREVESVGLTGDKNFSIYYPLPKFFFAHKNNQAVLDRIEKGLKIAYQDGTLITLWEKKYKASLDSANIHNRTIITLENPYISKLDTTFKKYSYAPLGTQAH